VDTSDGTYRGGRADARGIAFELFVKEILRRDPNIDLIAASLPYEAAHGSADYGSDFVASRDGIPLLIEAAATTPQTNRRMEQVRLQLQRAGQQYSARHPDVSPRLVLACSGVLSRPKTAMASEASLEIWDGPYLRNWAENLGIDVPSGVAFDDSETASEPDAESRYTHALLWRLDGIRPGDVGWRAYEKYCEDLLNFLFVPPLNPAISQSRDGRGVNRRDYILPNYALDGGFWQFMRTHYDAHFVVAEVKNLRGRPGKDEILQVANYLNRHGTGLFALILARREPDDTARWICREQWVQHGKLIVGLHDEDVRQMVKTRLAGNDPAELVRQKIEDFRLGI
jgi:hypothetical protein